MTSPTSSLVWSWPINRESANQRKVSMANEVNRNSDQEESAQAKPKFDIKKILIPIFALVNIGVLGVGAWMTYNATMGYVSPSMQEHQAVQELLEQRKRDESVGGLFYTMPEITINLSGTPQRLVRLEMTFEMLDKEGFEEIVRNSPKARDAIVTILNDKSFHEMETVQGKLFLKDQVAVALNRQFHTAVIKDIYFSQFVVQAL
jgi:flagellar protein FliL